MVYPENEESASENKEAPNSSNTQESSNQSSSNHSSSLGSSNHSNSNQSSSSGSSNHNNGLGSSNSSSNLESSNQSSGSGSNNQGSCCCICISVTTDQCPHCQISCCQNHLDTHRLGEFCQPWRVEEMEGVGRILVASRDISAWEKVVYDEAVVVAPADSPVCLGCLSKVDGSVRCTKCKWLLCSQECENSRHHTEECSLYQLNGVAPEVQDFEQPHRAYSTILAIQRLLLASRTNKRAEDALDTLMDHWETRKEAGSVCFALEVMTKFFQEKLGLDWVTLEAVQHAYGVLKTNSVGFHGRDGRALFPLVCIMSHSCYGNAEPTDGMREYATFRAKRKIRKGEEITHMYIPCLNSTYSMQEILNKEWLFECKCSRCVDPTEFSSYFSSKQCSCGGHFLKHQEDDICELICDGCSARLNFTQQINREKELMLKISTLTKDELLALEDKLIEDGYHQHHHILIALYQRYLETVREVDEESLILVSRYSKRIFDVLMKLDPGCTNKSGKYLSLMIEADMKLISIKKKRNEIDDEDFRSGLRQVVQARKMAAKLQSNFCK